MNDPKYGGSGGPVCASSSNEDSFEVLAHEIGHSMAHLADEYSYEGNQPPCNAQTDCREANATLRTMREQIKWQDWIEATTPLPTTSSGSFGRELIRVAWTRAALPKDWRSIVTFWRSPD